MKFGSFDGRDDSEYIGVVLVEISNFETEDRFCLGTGPFDIVFHCDLCELDPSEKCESDVYPCK